MSKSQPPTVQPGRARRGRKPRLSREQIAAVALELIDRDGLASLSMQRIAERTGVGTMTLYGYFRSKDELLEAVVDAAVRPSKRVSVEGDWHDRMRAVVGAAHQTLSRHPALVEIRFRQPILRPDALRFGERVVGILREAGFDDSEAAAGFRLIFTYTFGFAGMSPMRDTSRTRRGAEAAAASLSAEQFPHLTATAAEWTRAMAGTDQFSYGLDRILDGLQARLHATTGA